MTTATQDILSLCPYTTEAVVWEEVCQLRFSNKNFFGQLNVTGNVLGLDNKKNISEPEQFKSVVKETLNTLTKSICNGRVNFLCKIAHQNSIYLV
jgi:hypothetical protein